MLIRLSPRSISAPRSSQQRRLGFDVLEERCVLTANIVLQWHQVMLDAMINDSYLGQNAKQPGPDRASRALAIVQASVFDAVNSIQREFEPYMTLVPGAQNASMDAAVAQSAYETILALYPDFQATLDMRLAETLATVSNPVARAAGIIVGHTTASAILAARTHDGSEVMMEYTPDDAPGHWQPDPLHPDQNAVGPMWGKVDTFGLRHVNQFQVPPPPKMTGSEYAEAFEEVKSYGGDGVTTPTLRTPEQTIIGIFWGCDGSPGISTPPRMYNQIAATLAESHDQTPSQTARLLALVNLSMTDAGITCWDAKYDYEFWRPITAIRRAAEDGNALTTADLTWSPLGAPADNNSGTNFTPPFPAYTSGHATFGATLFRTLARYFGTDQMNFTVSSDEFNGVTLDQDGSVRPVVTRSFSSFSQAAEENGQSRIYLGIHWKFDKEQGIRQGNQIADFVFQHYLKPRRGSGPEWAQRLEEFEGLQTPEVAKFSRQSSVQPLAATWMIRSLAPSPGDALLSLNSEKGSKPAENQSSGVNSLFKTSNVTKVQTDSDRVEGGVFTSILLSLSSTSDNSIEARR